MGLDMYLNRWPRISGIDYARVLNLLHENRKVPSFVGAGPAPRKPYYGDFDLEATSGLVGSNAILNQGKYSSLFLDNLFFKPLPQVGYWRKDDELHDWFVANVQGGKDDCGYYEVTKEHLERLLWDIQVQIDKAPIIPDSLRRTKKILTSVLKKTDWETETIVYHASW